MTLMLFYKNTVMLEPMQYHVFPNTKQQSIGCGNCKSKNASTEWDFIWTKLLQDMHKMVKEQK